MLILSEQESLAQYTTFKIGGPAAYFAEPESDEEVREAIAFAEEKQLPVVVLGGGSNVLIADQGFPGLVLHMANKEITWTTEGETTLAVSDAGVAWDFFVSECVMRGLWGVEALSGIPGTIGGGIVQNVGAYGKEVAECIEWVEVYDPVTEVIRRLDRASCHFAYRDSVFKHEEGKHLIILRAAFQLKKNGAPALNYKDLVEYDKNEKPIQTLGDVREAILAIRARKFPDLRTIGTAGSFFKNPIVSNTVRDVLMKRYPDAPHYPVDEAHTKLSAAWIIDHVLKMRGVSEGHVGSWEGQALVLITDTKATAEEVTQFASKIISACMEKTNILLEAEVIFVGDIKK